MIEISRRRSLKFFGINATFWNEVALINGAYLSGSYDHDGRNGKCENSRPPSMPAWLEGNPYLRYDFAGDAPTLEAIHLLVLDRFLYTNDQKTLKSDMNMIRMAVRFFKYMFVDSLPENQNCDMKLLRIFPTQSLESLWCGFPPTQQNCCTNDMPTLAALTSVLRRLLQLPPELVDTRDRDEWSTLFSQLPPLPTTTTLNAAYYCPAPLKNVEAPEMYAVHPYRIYTVARRLASDFDPSAPSSVDIAIKSWNTNTLAQSNTGWTQGVMNAALLGMVDEAANMVLERANNTAPADGYRYPGFPPHLQDYEPSADHYAVFNHALQLMLLQPTDIGAADDPDDVAPVAVLFPTWPCQWNVNARIHAPRGTVIMVTLEHGEVTALDVSPPAMADRIIIRKCQRLR